MSGSLWNLFAVRNLDRPKCPYSMNTNQIQNKMQILQYRITSVDTKGTFRVEGLYDTLEIAERCCNDFRACFPLCQFNIVKN